MRTLILIGLLLTAFTVGGYAGSRQARCTCVCQPPQEGHSFTRGLGDLSH